MTHSRRTILRTASALSALAVGASATASAADCSGTPAWDATTLYEAGDRVQHPDGDGVDALWEAALDSRNAEPSRSSSYWDHVGDCDGSGGGGNDAPTAAFTVSPSSPAPGESATFDASDSSDADGSIQSYDWELGDGTTASGQTVSHSYDSAGDYTVTLIITDDAGATDSTSSTVGVDEESGGGGGADCDGVPQWDPDTAYSGGDQVVHDGRLWTAEWWTQGTEPAESENVWTLEGACGNFGPDAVASASPTNPAAGESVTFDASDSSDSDGTITGYDWAFGDGSSASGETVTHAYDADGSYTATLTVTDDAGATGTDSVTISVGDDGGSGGHEDDKFAPYQGTWGDVPNETLNASTDRVVLSFVGDATSGDGVNPGWLTSDGQRPLGDFADEIQTLQNDGIEVWVAIGGWDGRTVARDATDATALKDAYAEIVDTLGVTHLDIDDENADEADRDGSVYRIRNEALAMLQDERPEVEVSYTVPAGTGGIENRNYAPAKNMVSDAVDQGVELSYVNIMTMDFGPTTADKIASAGQGTVDWLANVYPDKSEAERWEMLGVTPNINESDFTTDTAQNVVDWAEGQDLGLLTFWALYHDDGSFSDVFYQFEDDED